MHFEGRQFGSVSDLLAHARESAALGLQHRVRGDDQEVALAWLDRLGCDRSDWLPAIGATLVALADDPGDAATAVADFFATATIGPALIAWLDLLMEGGFDARSSIKPTVLRADAPVGVDALRLGLQKHVDWLRDPQVIWFDLAPSSAAAVGNDGDLRAAVDLSVAIGRPRTTGALDSAVLGWLRHAALFSARIRAALPCLVDALLHGRSALGQVVGLEYAVRAADRRWCLGSLVVLATAAPDWLQMTPAEARALWPSDAATQLNLDARLPPGPELAGNLSDLLQDALKAANEELATSPRMDA